MGSLFYQWIYFFDFFFFFFFSFFFFFFLSLGSPGSSRAAFYFFHCVDDLKEIGRDWFVIHVDWDRDFWWTFASLGFEFVIVRKLQSEKFRLGNAGDRRSLKRVWRRMSGMELCWGSLLFWAVCIVFGWEPSRTTVDVVLQWSDLPGRRRSTE